MARVLITTVTTPWNGLPDAAYRLVEDRVLTYTSDVLEKDLVVAGPVTANLHASSSAPDKDWIVRLCDVWPDGRSMSVCDGILRARYRESLTEPSGCEPSAGQTNRPG
jgi:predicted acyl esterase